MNSPSSNIWNSAKRPLKLEDDAGNAGGGFLRWLLHKLSQRVTFDHELEVMHIRHRLHMGYNLLESRPLDFHSNSNFAWKDRKRLHLRHRPKFAVADFTCHGPVVRLAFLHTRIAHHVHAFFESVFECFQSENQTSSGKKCKFALLRGRAPGLPACDPYCAEQRSYRANCADPGCAVSGGYRRGAIKRCTKVTKEITGTGASETSAGKVKYFHREILS